MIFSNINPNLEVHAADTVTITFNSNGGTEVPAQSINSGEKAVKPTDPTKTDFTFAGWYTDNTTFQKAYDFNTAVSVSTTLYAKWACTVSFASNGGSDVASAVVDANTTVSEPAPAPTKTGYTLAGWYSDSTLSTAYNFSSPVTKNLTLYAKWTANKYTVTFNSNGGSAVDAKTVDYDTAVTAPAAPTKTGHTFASWCSDSALATVYDFNTKVTEDITLYAKWTVNQYTVTYDSNGGSAVASQSVDYDTAAALPSAPTKAYYNFGGWYTDQALTQSYDFATPVTKNITLYAKWTDHQYTVNQTALNYGGENITYTANEAITYTVGKTTASVEAGGSFTVPAATTTFTIRTAADSVTLTAVPGTGYGVISTNPQTLADATPTATFILQKTAASVSLYKQWEDGIASNKSIDGMALALQFKYETGDWTDLTTANMQQFGFAALPSMPEHTGNDSQWSYTFISTLYPSIWVDGQAKKVTWRLKETTVPSAYVSSYMSTDPTVLLNTLKEEYKANKIWQDNANQYATRPTVEAWLKTITVKKKSLVTDETSVIVNTADSSAEGYLSLTESGKTWTISMPNALKYDENGYPYSYWITEAVDANGHYASASSTDYYEPTYLNQKNYASITAGLYTGGTLTNTLTNEETFDATKVWKDDNSSATQAERPVAKLTLYRYPDEAGQSYQTGSPVPGATTLTIDNTKQSSDIKFPTDGTTLPTYNDDGVRYIYFAKETLTTKTNTYEQVLKNTTAYAATPGTTILLFNGGELDNKIKGTVSKSATKTWAAAARQDEDAVVTMAVLQKDPVTGIPKDTSGNYIPYKTEDLSGFGTEHRSLTADFTGLPKYNDDGLPYEYTVVEYGVQTYVGTTLTNATTETVDNVEYIVTGDGYRYRQSTTVDGDNTTITNTLVGNAEVVIDKTFTGGVLADNTEVKYTVYQNGIAIGTVTRTYNKTTETEGTNYKPGTITVEKYSDLDGNTNSALLPRYNDRGAEYRYTVSESVTPENTYSVNVRNSSGEDTYAAGTTYANEKYTKASATVSNSPKGTGMGITVHKIWIDAGETLYRKIVTVELQYNDAGTWTTIGTGTIDTDTDYTYISIPDAYQEAYTTWTANTAATGAGSFRVVETKLGNYSVVPDGDSSIIAFAGSSGHESGWSFVSTPEQNYDVSATATINSSFDFSIQNKRVGVEQVVLSKTWVDGNNAQSTRPSSLTYTLTASEPVFDGKTTKDYTMSPDVNGVWELNIEGLQKYDLVTGAYISYKVAEKSQAPYSQSVSHKGYVIGASHTGDTDTYAFTNTLAGSVQPYMNKYWMDLGDATAISKRPDIYPVLYRSTTVNGVTTYETMGYVDRNWTEEQVSANWWKCQFISQPKYNDKGYEYTYYVGEAFSSAVLNDYATSGAYTNEPDAATGSYTETGSKFTITVDGKDIPVAKFNNDGTGGTIVNKPQATRTVSGTKTWTNLPAAFKKTYLPNATFQLWRYHYGQTEADEEEVMINSKDIEATLLSGKTTFSFDQQVDRYDEYGKPYTYVVKEINPTTASVTYKITNDVKNGLVVTNEYKQDQNFTVSFTKTWSGLPANTALKPKVTLTLVRYLQTKDAQGNESPVSTTREVVSATAAANAYANPLIITSDTTNVGWTHLAYYGPNGIPYQYRVEESNLPNGYKVYAGTSPVTIGTNGYEAVVTGTYDDAKETGIDTASLTNKYGEIVGSLNITKTWGIQDTLWTISARPASIPVHLYRKCASMSAPESVQDQDIVLSNTSNPVWQTTVGGLQIYAPNGEIYTYTVTEDTLDGYLPGEITGGVNAKTSSLDTITVTNKPITTAVSASKTMQYTNGAATIDPTNAQLLFDQSFNAIPVSITYRFLYSTDNGASWNLLKRKSDGTIQMWLQSIGTRARISMTVPRNHLTCLQRSLLVAS
jgi:uncharacterized repeat protein (TIGR02543 family)